MIWVGILLAISKMALSSPSEIGTPGIWPQWRGPHRNGTVDSAPWPNKLDAGHLQTIWRQEIGHGYSGPIVSVDRVFTVETRDKRQEIVRTFNRTSGEQLWETSWAGAMKVPFFAARNGSWVRSTPACDGEHLYVAGMRDVLVCLAASDGTVKWRVDHDETQFLSAELRSLIS
jgi:outer membrane protein assembly factor BamB